MTTATLTGQDPTAVAITVRGALARILNRPIDKIQPECSLEGDLGLDSITLIHANIAIEEELRISAPGCEATEASLVTVGDLISLVQGKLGGEVVRC